MLLLIRKVRQAQVARVSAGLLLACAGCIHAPQWGHTASAELLLPASLTSNADATSASNPSVRPTYQQQTSQIKLPASPTASSVGKPLPITLPAALQLTQANPLDIQIADERVRIASAQYDRSRLLWLPNINAGVDYFRHDGQIQDIIGEVFGTSRSAILAGAGPQAVVSTSDAIYAPLAARQLVAGFESHAQAIRNDTTLQVASVYFNVQQARGELAGSLESLRRAEDLVARTTKLAPDLTPLVEIDRARTEAARRRQAVEIAYEKWQVASAELVRLLRLDATTIVEPAEEPSLLVSLIDQDTPVPDLITLGLTHRPELAAHQAVVQAALVRLQHETNRPYLPVLGMRGVGSNTPGIAGGLYGGGINDDMQNFGTRFSINLQAVWEFQNLGFGNQALVRERQAEQRRALLELQRVQELIMAEITQAHAQLVRASKRVTIAEEGITHAIATADKNLEGLGQTKRLGEQLVLIFRPQEAVASVSALDLSYREYYQAVADHNRAQFRLYRAIGHSGSDLCLTPQTPKPLPGTVVLPGSEASETTMPVSGETKHP